MQGSFVDSRGSIASFSPLKASSKRRRLSDAKCSALTAGASHLTALSRMLPISPSHRSSAYSARHGLVALPAYRADGKVTPFSSCGAEPATHFASKGALVILLKPLSAVTVPIDPLVLEPPLPFHASPEAYSVAQLQFSPSGSSLLAEIQPKICTQSPGRCLEGQAPSFGVLCVWSRTSCGSASNIGWTLTGNWPLTRHNSSFGQRIAAVHWLPLRRRSKLVRPEDESEGKSVEVQAQPALEPTHLPGQSQALRENQSKFRERTTYRYLPPAGPSLPQRAAREPEGAILVSANGGVHLIHRYLALDGNIRPSTQLSFQVVTAAAQCSGFGVPNLGQLVDQEESAAIIKRCDLHAMTGDDRLILGACFNKKPSQISLMEITVDLDRDEPAVASRPVLSVQLPAQSLPHDAAHGSEEVLDHLCISSDHRLRRSAASGSDECGSNSVVLLASLRDEGDHALNRLISWRLDMKTDVIGKGCLSRAFSNLENKRRRLTEVPDAEDSEWLIRPGATRTLDELGFQGAQVVALGSGPRRIVDNASDEVSQPFLVTIASCDRVDDHLSFKSNQALLLQTKTLAKVATVNTQEPDIQLDSPIDGDIFLAVRKSLDSIAVGTISSRECGHMMDSPRTATLSLMLTQNILDGCSTVPALLANVTHLQTRERRLNVLGSVARRLRISLGSTRQHQDPLFDGQARRNIFCLVKTYASMVQVTETYLSKNVRNLFDREVQMQHCQAERLIVLDLLRLLQVESMLSSAYCPTRPLEHQWRLEKLEMCMSLNSNLVRLVDAIWGAANTGVTTDFGNSRTKNGWGHNLMRLLATSPIAVHSLERSLTLILRFSQWLSEICSPEHKELLDKLVSSQADELVKQVTSIRLARRAFAIGNNAVLGIKNPASSLECDNRDAGPAMIGATGATPLSPSALGSTSPASVPFIGRAPANTSTKVEVPTLTDGLTYGSVDTILDEPLRQTWKDSASAAFFLAARPSSATSRSLAAISAIVEESWQDEQAGLIAIKDLLQTWVSQQEDPSTGHSSMGEATSLQKGHSTEWAVVLGLDSHADSNGNGSKSGVKSAVSELSNLLNLAAASSPKVKDHHTSLVRSVDYVQNFDDVTRNAPEPSPSGANWTQFGVDFFVDLETGEFDRDIAPRSVSTDGSAIALTPLPSSNPDSGTIAADGLMASVGDATPPGEHDECVRLAVKRLDALGRPDAECRLYRESRIGWWALHR